MSTPETGDRRWLQVNVALRRRDGDALAGARAVFAALAPLLDGWRGTGAVDSFHFMRKPPDLRLRLRGPDPRGVVLEQLTRALRELHRAGAVERFSQSVYEPETRLFGGEQAMALVHDWFDADTSAWLALDALQAAGRATVAPEVLACAAINELLTLMLDASETWDVWCNLAVLAGARPSPGATGPRRAPPLPAGLRERASAEERRVLDGYRVANERLAGGLGAVRDAGRLECGLRALLAFVALFHFHRYGLDGSRQAAVADEMRAAWNPRRDLRGSTC